MSVLTSRRHLCFLFLIFFLVVCIIGVFAYLVGVDTMCS
jgi:hypothetical protein